MKINWHEYVDIYLNENNCSGNILLSLYYLFDGSKNILKNLIITHQRCAYTHSILTGISLNDLQKSPRIILA